MGAPPPPPEGPGPPRPRPGSLFARAKSNQKHAREEKPFRWGFSPVTPSSATTQRGAQAPLWKPPHNLRSLCSSVEAPLRTCRAGGESKEGAAAPSLVVVGEGYIREGPHRKGPSLVRLFGYFFGVEKVTRGTGAEPLLNPDPGRSPEKKRCGTRRPHTGYHLFRAAAEASSWAMRERSFSAWSRWFWTMWAGALEVKASLLSLASMPFR